MRICIGIFCLLKCFNILDFVTYLSITFDIQLDVASESVNGSSYESVSEIYVYMALVTRFVMVGPFRKCKIFGGASFRISESSDSVGIVWIVFIPRVLDDVCMEIGFGAVECFLIAETAAHTGLAWVIRGQ